MRTRNRLLPVLLLLLAVSTLAVLAAPVANAYMRPPAQVVIIDPGDPDENGAYKTSAVPPSSGEPIRLTDGPSQTCASRPSVPDAGITALATPHKGSKWQLRDILFYLLFQSPVLR